MKRLFKSMIQAILVIAFIILASTFSIGFILIIPLLLLGLYGWQVVLIYIFIVLFTLITALIYRYYPLGKFRM